MRWDFGCKVVSWLRGLVLRVSDLNSPRAASGFQNCVHDQGLRVKKESQPVGMHRASEAGS